MNNIRHITLQPHVESEQKKRSIIIKLLELGAMFASAVLLFGFMYLGLAIADAGDQYIINFFGRN